MSFIKSFFCSFIGKHAGMWTASNQWLEFDLCGANGRLRGGIMIYLYMNFGEYSLFSAMNVHIDT